MQLNEFLEHLNRINLGGPGDIPPRDNVRALERLLTTALATEEFAIDCVARQLELVRRGVPETPFLLNAERNYGFRFPHWAPYLGMSPHEHNEWIVSAVIHNTMTIYTYEYEIARTERRLQSRNAFIGRPGQAGHIYDCGIHNPWNKTDRWSTSIHIYSLGDLPRLLRSAGPIEGMPGTPTLHFDIGGWPELQTRAFIAAEALKAAHCGASARVHHFFSQYTLRGILELLQGARTPRVPELLRDIYHLGNLDNRLLAARIMAAYDAMTARGWLDENARACKAAEELSRSAEDWSLRARAVSRAPIQPEN